jgi:hypothetical protein
MTSRKAEITKRVVDGLEPDTLVWDTKLIGFGVRRQKRNRVYVLKTRVGARQRWFTIGKHGSPWTPEKARREALVILGEIERGQDPATNRDTESMMPTMASLAVVAVL